MDRLRRAACGTLSTATLALAFALGPVALASAAPLSLAEAERLALEGDAMIAAYGDEAAAYRDRAVAARQLPNPEARVGAVNVPADSLSLSADDMTMLEVGVMQRFTPDRGPMGDRLDRLADGREARIVARTREVRLAVRSAWAEAAATARERELVREQQGWVRRMEAAATSMYASGEGVGQAELLNARLELAMLDERALMLDEEAAMRRAALVRWLGDVADLQLELPRPAPPSPLATLEERLARHPAHVEAAAAIAAAEAEAAVARAKFRPMWGIDVAYGFRSGREGMAAAPVDPMAADAMTESIAPGPRRSDMLSAMVTVELPFFTKHRQQRELSAARAEVRAAERMREDGLRMLTMSLREAHARATRAGAMLELMDTRVLPTARTAAEAALAAYAAGSGSYDSVVAATRARLDAEVRRLRTATELAIAGAQLDALAGDLP